jgi:hypothetical protein
MTAAAEIPLSGAHLAIWELAFRPRPLDEATETSAEGGQVSGEPSIVIRCSSRR